MPLIIQEGDYKSGLLQGQNKQNTVPSYNFMQKDTIGNTTTREK